MKRSEFKDYIKETIVELLSEEEGKVSTDDPAQAAKLAKQGVDVDLTEDDDTEPTKAELGKTKSLAKTKEELAKVISIMKDVVADWKKAEGKEKEDLKDQLKTLTISKKKLEKELEALL